MKKSQPVIHELTFGVLCAGQLRLETSILLCVVVELVDAGSIWGTTPGTPMTSKSIALKPRSANDIMHQLNVTTDSP